MLRTLLSAAAVILAAIPCAAKDVFLTVGGGFAPSGNQVSLEKNVLFFEAAVREIAGPEAQHDIFFSDGEHPGRDIVYRAEAPVPPANRLLASLFEQEKQLHHRYRNHRVHPLAGPATKAQLKRWFVHVGQELKPGDRLFLYATGHGAKTDDTANPHLYLWQGESLSVRELATQLDTLHPGVKVIVVMVQCYSGGFANLVFQGGDPRQGLAPGRRCGFFATIAERPAAGCTSEIEEADYQDYSTFFWSALAGKSRSGRLIDTPDYDGNGRVTLAEAHAYTLLEARTIDIPVRTSDVLLRFLCQVPAESGIVAPLSSQQMLRQATASERAVWEGIVAEFELSEPLAQAEARSLLATFERKRKALEERLAKLHSHYRSATQRLSTAVCFRWPELANPWHPQVPELLAREGEAIVSAVERHPRYRQYETLRREILLVLQQRKHLDLRIARLERLLYLAETLALRGQLPRRHPDRLRPYERILELEQASF